LTSGATALSGALAIANPSEYGMATRLLALAVIFIGTAPLARWLFQPDRQGLPVFELFMVFHAICFGFAGLMPQASSLTTRSALSTDEWNAALVAVAISLSCTVAGYYFGASRFARPRAAETWPFRLSPSLLSLAVPALLALVVAFFMFANSIPKDLHQTIQTVVLFWFIILVTAAFHRDIQGLRRLVVIYALVPLNALLFSSFANATLYGMFGVLIPAALARFTASRRVPWLLAGLVVAMFLVFQPVKSEYRNRVGGADSSPSAVVDFTSLAIERFSGQRDAGSTSWEWFAEAFRRLNHLHVTAAIMADTPGFVPYADGATYAPLFTKLIPRVVWPGKPIEAQGNAWAHRYGYLDGSDDVTSFNLPFLPEMYMNFGYPGIIVIGCALGLFMAFAATRLWMLDGDSSLIAFSILTALPLLTPESNLSLLAGRAAISGVAAYGSLMLMSVMLPAMRASKRSAAGVRLRPVAGHPVAMANDALPE
jgi:hypothetical protein